MSVRRRPKRELRPFHTHHLAMDQSGRSTASIAATFVGKPDLGGGPNGERAVAAAGAAAWRGSAPEQKLLSPLPGRCNDADQSGAAMPCSELAVNLQ